MPVPVPGIDLNTCQAWTENDINMYNSYDFFLAKINVEMRPSWETFKKMCKPRRWTPNHGDTMRGIRKNPSPHLRQDAFPELLSSQPKADTMNVAETATDAKLFWHEFESPVFYFLPDFQDFLTHVTDTGVDIMEKVARFEELFYRAMMFHMSPFLMIAKGNSVALVENVPFAGTAKYNPATATNGKNTAWLAATINTHLGEMTHLTLPSLSAAHTKMAVNLGIPAHDGSNLPAGDSKAIDGKYLLVTGEEAWDQFTFDPYLQQHKNCDLDVVHDHFQGSIFGRITGKLEHKPWHFRLDGTYVAPEIRVEGDGALNDGETIPNPDYVNIDIPSGGTADNHSPLAISWLFGKPGFDAIESGPPPAAFTKDTPPHNFPGMKWNGEVYLTKDFLLDCVDAVTGEARPKTNSKGRYIKYESTLTLGCYPRQRRWAIPILHKRRQGV